MRFTSSRTAHRAFSILFLVSVWLWAGRAWSQLTPDNPRVQLAIRNAVAFLETQDDGRLGGKALIGLTLAKYGETEEHPKIAAAIRAIQAQTKQGPENIKADIYSTGISIMCLVAVDPSKYRSEIESLVESLHLRQKRHGAWGYPETHPSHAETCDTSMTQYAVLGLWEAEDQAGVETEPQIWDKVAQWLVLTQDPNGGFGYQGNPATRLGRNEKQAGVRHSMTVAAMASLYIVKDRVGFRKLAKTSDDETPAAFELFQPPEQRLADVKTQVDVRTFAKTVASGNRWIENEYKIDELTGWVHYSLYALERYESLREAEAAGSVEPIPKSDQSKWYNAGARHLLRTQAENGSWESSGGPVPDTCFATLFLMGSTRKTLSSASVTRFAAGRLIGGSEIPPTGELRLRDGRLVVLPLDAPIEQVFQILSTPNHKDYARAIESLADLADSGTVAQLQPHTAALAKLALRGDLEARGLAVAALARSRDLDQVPLLIHLLGDRSDAVVQAANQALAQLSRQSSTFGLERSVDEQQRQRAVEHWKAWYLSIRPEAELDTFRTSGLR